jgi:hypothetical protein
MVSTTRIRFSRPPQVDGKKGRKGKALGYGSDMARATRPLRFSAKTVGEEIEAVRARLGIPVEKITERIGIGRTHWYAKVSGDKPFRWEQAAKIAEEFGAGRGWPIVPWDEALAWERHLEGK